MRLVRLIRLLLPHLGLWSLITIALLLVVFLMRERLGAASMDGALDLWTVFDRATMVLGFVVTTFAIYTTLYGLQEGGWVRVLFRSKRLPLNEISVKAQSATDILIMLYFNNKAFAETILNIYEPRVLLVLGSSESDVEDFLLHVKTLSLPLAIDKAVWVDDSSDADQTEAKTKQLIEYARLQARYRELDPEKITCDVTLATKPMTIGMMSGAKQANVNAGYVESKRDPDGKPVPGTHQVRFVHERQAVA